MTEGIQAFHIDLMQEVMARAHASGAYTRTTLVECLAGRLVEAEELQDWTPCYCEDRGHRNRSIGIDGYSDDDVELDGTLQVLIAEPRLEGPAATLSTAEVKSAFGRAAGFVADARAGRLHDKLEPSTAAADFAQRIFEAGDRIQTLRILVLSNASLGARYKDAERHSIEKLKTELHVWDLSRFLQLAAMGGREELDLDITEVVPGGLPALPAGLGDAGYRAYLCVVPGAFLADVYAKYGSRLLEANVRAFLSARGKVNKGIRRTIVNTPDRFFAFNNGITAIATSVETATTGNIVRIRGLQIVNGGQTTASLHGTRERDDAPLDKVFVQMKLSVLAPEVAQVLIPEISRYANTQNKVSDADLFANHPFHRRVEELSRQLWAPSQAGSRQLTHWFYERARAQYQTEQSRLSLAEKKAFLLQNPKEHVITKTDLAKYENCWRGLPHLLCCGAQKNFVKYAEVIRVEYDRNPSDFNQRWFQHLVAKAILFNATIQIVSKADWYTDYRAQTVAHAVARLVKLIGDSFPGHVLDLDQIWRAQALPDVLIRQLGDIAKAVFGVLIAPPSDISNVGEWAKKEACWRAVIAAPIPLLGGLTPCLKTVEEDRKAAHDAHEQARQPSGVNIQSQVIKLAQEGFWERATSWPRTEHILSSREMNLLKSAARGAVTWVLSDSQARTLLGIAKKLEEEGLLLATDDPSD